MQYLISSQFVDNSEMKEISNDKELETYEEQHDKKIIN